MQIKICYRLDLENAGFPCVATTTINDVAILAVGETYPEAKQRVLAKARDIVQKHWMPPPEPEVVDLWKVFDL